MREDILLIKQLRSGNKLVFKQMFEQYYYPLRGFSGKFISDEGACDDIVQEAFLGLWNKRKEIQNGNAVKGYLYSSVRNACLNYLRHENVKKKFEQLEQDPYAGSEIEDAFLVEEVHAEIYKSIKELPPQSRRVVLLSVDGLANPEIAEEMEVSVNTVKTLKKRAYQALRSKLKGVHWIMLLLLS